MGLEAWGLAALAGVVSGVISGWLIWYRQSQKQWEDRDVEKLYEVLNGFSGFIETIPCADADPPKGVEEFLVPHARRIKESAFVLVHEKYSELGQEVYKFARENQTCRWRQQNLSQVATDAEKERLREEAIALMDKVWELMPKNTISCRKRFRSVKPSEFLK